MKTTALASRKRILLVDDDPAVRQSIKLLLSIDRHKVTEAANGEEALLLFTGSAYDLVIIDYLMPGMLGDELARNIRHLSPRQPIVMLTGHKEKIVAAEMPVDCLLCKPIGVEDLRRAIRTG